jgi:hypothetical protein
MSTPSTRGKRTRGIFIGPLANPKRDPKPERLTRVARAFCPRVEVAVLAFVAEKAGKSDQDAGAATLAYENARAAYAPPPDMPPLANNMAGESALGRKLVAGVVEANRRYACHAHIERKAPAITAIQQWLENLGKAAASLVAAHNAPLDALGKVVARADIEAHLSPGTELREFAATAQRIAWAVLAVVSEMDDEVGCKAGEAWDRWILDLTKFCRESGLPHTVAHDSELRSDGQPSEFVLLVSALMRELPPNLRLHDGSYGALAHAISKARNAAKKRRLLREEQETHSAE